MLRPRAILGMLAIALLMGGWLHGEDSTKDDKKDTKVKGTLPANWAKLGLTDEQRQKVYRIQADFKEKLAELDKQVKELKEKERADLEKVLSDEQKKRLREIAGSKLPEDKKDDKKKDDKKKDDKKKDDKKDDKKE